MTLIEHGRIVPKHMFSMIVPLEELEAALKELRSNPDLVKVFVSSDISKREIL
jgi:threonine dehydrogenase-like Zn-dependent dehydrogenase